MVLKWYQKQNGSQGIANSYYAVVATHQWARQPASHSAGSISLWLALCTKPMAQIPLSCSELCTWLCPASLLFSL